MIVVASKNGRVGIAAAVDVLRRGGSAVDAVEAGIIPVESNPEDHSVGYSGYPNLIGEVELDASIMDGLTLAAGAVGAIRGYEHPISIARKVMEELPHCFLVGTGAERFAKELGFPTRDLLTEDARRVWHQILEEKAPEVYGQRMKYLDSIRRFVKITADPEKPNETVNFLAQDVKGNIACGVSTSGWAWKYPGRLGDSPVIGAGNYADNRYGAAACTGRGEMAIRCATARSIVLYMKMGLALAEAGREAFRDLDALVDPFAGSMNAVALAPDGSHAAFSNMPEATYIYMTAEMGEPVEAARIFVPPAKPLP
ncbi:MAG: N(4)-(beta-N-acetylglucosaminyl)-L-asparaginase [Bacillota bacterium]|nr:N(4)-(beta-N-acetylglucosaminyl)-L-asparaginase [Bacillota bacterium]